MSLLAEHNLPFAIALGGVVLLSLFQIVGFSAADADADLDADAGADVGFLGAATTLLGIGRVPFFIWLIVFLFLFAGLGLGIQALAAGLLGAPFGALLAAALALGAALPTTATLVRPLAWILPQDETTAVSLDSLVGRRATIAIGRAAAGHPARAKVRDRHGHAHHVMVEPHEAGSELHEGDEVLLVRREGQTFFGMPVAERKLAPIG